MAYKNDREDRDYKKNDDREDRGDFRRKRPRPPLDLEFDYKDYDALRQFIGEGGRIVPARISRLNRNQQHDLTIQVKRARMLALLPIADSHRMP